MKVATLAVRVSSDNALTEGIAKCTVKKKKNPTIYVSLIWHFLSKQKGSKMERDKKQTHQYL